MKQAGPGLSPRWGGGRRDGGWAFARPPKTEAVKAT
eukprot:CAMPEP_0177430042 /NCGR_PEP_ID=MMETSP0368-20130122/75436_1 /TAXON_ID=447022 ORGANISM="Scrippsiella hangoei-like, Strain SHHI-4" /NCGR_SAMPLE_ID=MMETSP0368 /ASSEMBLY_ACC=CAM_ASM_000363 /LENGTH=35 /DNA_ID= /DNA_START= /DNA_END= /DNA_ORIENTATION=